METITIPQELVLVIAAGIGYLVTNGLKSLFPNANIQGTASQITAAVVTTVVALGNQLLLFVPAPYQPAVLAGFTLVLAILGAYGIHYSVKSR